jgi:hypothetical protein
MLGELISSHQSCVERGRAEEMKEENEPFEQRKDRRTGWRGPRGGMCLPRRA